VASERCQFEQVIAEVPAWLPLSLFALVVWAVQRLLSKVALSDLGTDFKKDGVISGMLSVNGQSGAVWFHSWHGRHAGGVTQARPSADLL
jgi:hypothetical protein